MLKITPMKRLLIFVKHLIYISLLLILVSDSLPLRANKMSGKTLDNIVRLSSTDSNTNGFESIDSFEESEVKWFDPNSINQKFCDGKVFEVPLYLFYGN